ncbi:MAG: hypothetical protein MUD16_13255 [Desulfobacterales bacterium]|jgi:predicted HicB family RNase H-like nuclease|nr:hypothetical protein [Desulfobacterales bacterium]
MSKRAKPMCADPSQEITIRIPCALADRVAAYAKEQRTSLANVVVEALDLFLRRPPPP